MRMMAVRHEKIMRITILCARSVATAWLWLRQMAAAAVRPPKVCPVLAEAFCLAWSEAEQWQGQSAYGAREKTRMASQAARDRSVFCVIIARVHASMPEQRREGRTPERSRCSPKAFARTRRVSHAYRFRAATRL